VLDGSGDANSDIQLGSHNLAGLSYLVIIGYIACTTGFDPVAATGGSATIEKQSGDAAASNASSSSFVVREITK
jgi:hypothetical protein